MYSSTSRHTDFEISGQLAYAIISNMQEAELKPLLHKHALDTIDPNQWYAASDLTGLFDDVARQSNFTSNFVAIGIAAANLLIQFLPPKFQNVTLEEILMAEEALIFSNYRNGDPGYIKVTKVNDSTYYNDSKTPWPDDLNYGFIFAFVRHFRPQDKRFTLRKDPSLPGQDDGGEFLRLVINLE